VVLTSLSKHTRNDFQIIIAFGHSSFIISQSMVVLRNMVLKKYLACRTFSKCQPYSNEGCLSIRTYTYKIKAGNEVETYPHYLAWRWGRPKLIWFSGNL